MLSDEIRSAMSAANKQVAAETMTMDMWRLFDDRMEDIAERLEKWERSSDLGENGKRDLPPNVVRIAEALEKKGVQVGASNLRGSAPAPRGPGGGDAA